MDLYLLYYYEGNLINRDKLVWRRKCLFLLDRTFSTFQHNPLEHLCTCFNGQQAFLFRLQRTFVLMFESISRKLFHVLVVLEPFLSEKDAFQGMPPFQ